MLLILRRLKLLSLYVVSYFLLDFRLYMYSLCWKKGLFSYPCIYQEIWIWVPLISLKACGSFLRAVSCTVQNWHLTTTFTRLWHIFVLPKYLRSSSSPISTPASLSMATASRYSSLRVGSKNLNGSHGNCLFTVWISVWNLYRSNKNRSKIKNNQEMYSSCIQ